jgi:hypothetical protein
MSRISLHAIHGASMGGERSVTCQCVNHIPSNISDAIITPQVNQEAYYARILAAARAVTAAQYQPADVYMPAMLLPVGWQDGSAAAHLSAMQAV